MRLPQHRDMPRNIIAVVDDLFFASKIRGTAEELGVNVSFVRNVRALLDAARRDQPSLIICDLRDHIGDKKGLTSSPAAELRLHKLVALPELTDHTVPA